MQNDVVRWPAAGKCNKTIKERYAQCGNDKRGFRGVHDADTFTSQTSTRATKMTSFPRNFKLNETSSQSPRCDTTPTATTTTTATATTTTTTDYNNIYYLVHNVVKNKSHLRGEPTRRHRYLCGNIKDGSCCKRCPPVLPRSRYRIELRNCLTLLLQVCTVVFVCSLNVGFVASANVVNESSYLEVDKLPYELDYGYEGNRIQDHYTHTWAVHVPDGDEDGKADMVARDHGFINLGKVSRNMNDIFLIVCLKLVTSANVALKKCGLSTLKVCDG